jgi:hypothetical protein
MKRVARPLKAATVSISGHRDGFGGAVIFMHLLIAPRERFDSPNASVKYAACCNRLRKNLVSFAALGVTADTRHKLFPHLARIEFLPELRHRLRELFVGKASQRGMAAQIFNVRALRGKDRRF